MAEKPAPPQNMNRDMAKPAYKARSQIFAAGVTHWLLVTLVLSLGFGQLLRFETIYGALYFHDILTLAILAINLQGRGRNLVIPPGIKLIVLGLALGWLTALFRYPVQDLLIPSLYLARLVAYLALFLLLQSTKIKIPSYAFLLAGLTTLTIGLVQYFLLPDMRIFQYLGWDDHLNRLTLPHFDPTFTGVMLGLALLIIPLKSWYVSLLLSFGILLTYSRSVWLSLAITVGYFMLKKRQFNLLIIGICVLIIPIFFLPKKFGEGTNLLRTYSVTSRLRADLAYVQKYRWDLLIGRGMNTLMIDSPSSLYPNHANSPNNSYLYILATSGVIGLWGWLIFLKNLYLHSAYKPAIIFVALASLFNNVLFYPFALLWILLMKNTETNR